MSDSNLTLSAAPALEGAIAPAAAGLARDLWREVDLPRAVSPPLAVVPEPGPGAAVRLELHRDLGDVKREWKAFERSADCTAFQSFEWLSKWQQHIGSVNATIPAIVLGRGADGMLLFIVPLAVEGRAWSRRLTWLGSPLCDYNAPLLAPQFSALVNEAEFVCLWHDIVRLLRDDPRYRFDFIDLQKMPEAVGSQRNPFLAIKVNTNPSGAYVATLGRDWEAFYAQKRSASTRKRERRQAKQLAEHGAIGFVNVDDRADVVNTMVTLIDQKSRAFARMGVEDLFARRGYRAFYLDIATDHNARGLTHVSRLDVGPTIAATNLGLIFRDCYYLVLSSYHDGEIARFGPGRAHLHELIRHAIARGYHQFDFTIGDEPYKRDWSDIERRLYDHLAVVTMPGAIVVALMLAFRRAKRFIKQTPVLWHAYGKARGLAGRLGRR